MKLGHIVNITEIDDSKKSSYLHIAQPVTLQTMLHAKKAANGIVDIDLVTIKHRSENVTPPAGFKIANDIEKYAWECIPALENITPRKPLPRLADIVTGLYETTDADFLIYTNLDIGLYPDFYIDVKKMLEDGFDALCINRIDLPKTVRGIPLDINTMDLIPRKGGKKHPGIDCFVFKREIVPSLKLGNVYIGFPPIGQVLKTQVEKNSNNFQWIKDKAITFHLGNDKPWANARSPYLIENHNQAQGLYVKCINV